MKDHEISIEELCRPLSAKTLPASAKWAAGNRPMSEKVARMASRSTSRQGPKARVVQDPRKG